MALCFLLGQSSQPDASVYRVYRYWGYDLAILRQPDVYVFIRQCGVSDFDTESLFNKR